MLFALRWPVDVAGDPVDSSCPGRGSTFIHSDQVGCSLPMRSRCLSVWRDNDAVGSIMGRYAAGCMRLSGPCPAIGQRPFSIKSITERIVQLCRRQNRLHQEDGLLQELPQQEEEGQQGAP
jgi:hypothetical protein